MKSTGISPFFFCSLEVGLNKYANRLNAINSFSKELEFTAYAYSATEKGYKERLDMQLLYLKKLTANCLWWDQYTPADEDEVEALFYLGIIRRAAQQLKAF